MGFFYSTRAAILLEFTVARLSLLVAFSIDRSSLPASDFSKKSNVSLVKAQTLQ
jgi:hypothetical protein